MVIKIGDSVCFQSCGVESVGVVLSADDACGLFVETKEPVLSQLGPIGPIVLRNRLWLTSAKGIKVKGRDGNVIGFELQPN